MKKILIGLLVILLTGCGSKSPAQIKKYLQSRGCVFSTNTEIPDLLQVTAITCKQDNIELIKQENLAFDFAIYRYRNSLINDNWANLRPADGSSDELQEADFAEWSASNKLTAGKLMEILDDYSTTE